MPRVVRDKLDRVGFKVHLKDWQVLSLPERERLRDLPCATRVEVEQYAETVVALVRGVTGRPPEKLQPKVKDGANR